MNPRILALAAGVAIGYVLGARDGRERYEQMKAKATQLWENPRVVRARRDVESYAREQAPLIRERAEAAAKAAPGVAKDVAGKVADTAKDVAGQVSDTAKDVADKTVATAKDVADKAVATAKDVSAKATSTAKDVRAKAGEVASDLRERGEAVVDSAVETAGRAREAALDVVPDSDADDEDAPKTV